MKTNGIKKEGGFTLVELAIVMVVIGLLLGALLTGQQLIDNARGKQFLADVKGLEALTWTYYDRKGVFPGDCNGDGVAGVVLVATADAAGTPAAANLLDAAVAAPTTLDCDGIAADTKDSGIADLRVEGLLDFDATKTNAQVGTHAANAQMSIAGVTDGTVTRNGLVFFEVPLWMAEMVDANLDGAVAGDAGRVRYVDNTAADGSLTWLAHDGTEQTATFFYLFDKGF